MKSLVAGNAVALCATVVLAGVAAESPVAGSEAIHWQTDRVDVRAEHLTLELFDQVFSPGGADVTITEGASGKRRWYTDVRWDEGEHTHALVFNFRHNDDEWYVDQVNRWVEGPMPPDHGGRYGSAAFRLRKATRTPLEQAFTGDIRRSGNGVLATCEDRRMSLLGRDPDGATLSIDGLRVTVAPRDPSLVERVLRRLGLTQKLDQDLSLLAEDCSLHGDAVALAGEIHGGSDATQ